MMRLLGMGSAALSDLRDTLNGPGGAHIISKPMPPPGPTLPPHPTEHAMDDYRITWAQEGREDRRISAVKYDKSAAEDYAGYKRAEPGVSDVRIEPVTK
ncbi:hypothetical protein ACFWG5_34390 [Streptomyces hydrogenans]|uniref:hypothetical protein n=1 Tax=Streptomyces TaxID=1883 RepID=UPI00363839B8